jgi:Family of unknown function (DUF6069)
MLSALTSRPAHSQAARRLRRPAAVVAVIMAAIALWAIAALAIGVNLQSPAFGPSQAPAALSAAAVAVTSGLAGLAAWGLLALLERTTRRPRQIWTVAALTALALSLGAPLSGHGISGASRVALACLHLLVGATLITLLGRTAAARHETISRPDHQAGQAA